MPDLPIDPYQLGQAAGQLLQKGGIVSNNPPNNPPNPPEPGPQPGEAPPTQLATTSAAPSMWKMALGIIAILAVGGGIWWWLQQRSPKFPRKRRRAREAADNPTTPGKGHGRVQSLLFPRSKFTPAKAKAWAKSHGYRHGKVDVTDRYVRLRQRRPQGRMRTVPFGQSGIKAVVSFR